MWFQEVLLLLEHFKTKLILWYHNMIIFISWNRFDPVARIFVHYKWYNGIFGAIQFRRVLAKQSLNTPKELNDIFFFSLEIGDFVWVYVSVDRFRRRKWLLLLAINQLHTFKIHITSVDVLQIHSIYYTRW